jgi:hypothetical protein
MKQLSGGSNAMTLAEGSHATQNRFTQVSERASDVPAPPSHSQSTEGESLKYSARRPSLPVSISRGVLQARIPTQLREIG